MGLEARAPGLALCSPPEPRPSSGSSCTPPCPSPEAPAATTWEGTKEGLPCPQVNLGLPEPCRRPSDCLCVGGFPLCPAGFPHPPVCSLAHPWLQSILTRGSQMVLRRLKAKAGSSRGEEPWRGLFRAPLPTRVHREEVMAGAEWAGADSRERSNCVSKVWVSSCLKRERQRCLPLPGRGRLWSPVPTTVLSQGRWC